MPRPKQLTSEEEETIEEMDYIEELEQEITKTEPPTKDIDLKHIKIMKILLGEKAKYLADLTVLEEDINKECNDNIFIQRLPIVTLIRELSRLYKYIQLRQFSIDDQNQSYQIELRGKLKEKDNTEELENLKEELDDLKRKKTDEERLTNKIKNTIEKYNEKLDKFEKGEIDKSEVNLARGEVWITGKDNPELLKELMEEFMKKGGNND